MTQQDQVLAKLVEMFPDGVVVDRRNRPSHGYRAVHFIASVQGKPVEVQVRTKLQDMWGQLSEAVSDAVDKDLKYGGGPEQERELLDTLSSVVYKVEAGKLKLRNLKGILGVLLEINRPDVK